MNYRAIITFIFVCLWTLTLSADAVRSVCNAGCGGSVDMSECCCRSSRDGDVGLADSVAYYVEHARWKEPWAYRALAECYRYGKGGVGKCLFNAIAYYDEADVSAAEFAVMAYDSDQSDELGLLNHLMDGLDRKRLTEEAVVSTIGGMTAPKPLWAMFLNEILSRPHAERKSFIESSLSVESDCDVMLVGFSYMSMVGVDLFEKMFLGTSDECLRRMMVIGERLPSLCDILGNELWIRYEQQSPDSERFLEMALMCMEKADRFGFLSRGNMGRVLAYSKKRGRDGRMPFSEDDLERFARICSGDD